MNAHDQATSRTIRRPRWAVTGAALLATVLALSGCTALKVTPGTDSNGATTGAAASSSAAKAAADRYQPLPETSPAAVPKGLEKFYSQKVDWSKCERNPKMECAKVDVPLDYANPDTRTIQLAVIKAPAESGDGKANLVLNPGGPGGPAVSLVADSLSYVVNLSVRQAYNVIGFDPRGVGDSQAVKCFANTAAKDAYLATSNDLNTDAGYNAQIATQKQFAQNCETMSDGILPYVDTLSSARDMDVIRAILGDNQLSYLGFSYGTLLGATYAKEFPKNVGRFVLDGAVDPALNGDGLSRGQAMGFEAAMRGYLTECIARGGTCPFTGSVDAAMKSIDTQLKALATKPLATKDPEKRQVTQNVALTAVISPMYRYEYWPLVLDPVFTALQKGDGDVILKWADAFNTREKGKFADNSTEAFTAINCADEQLSETLPQMRAEAVALTKAAPLFGQYLGYNSASCTGWAEKPKNSTAAAPINVTGVPPIVIIGATGDPATPYPWSIALQKQISDSVLVTSQSWGHTAYPGASSCIAKAISAFYLEGTVPENGLKCDGGGPKTSIVPEDYEEKNFG